MKKMHSLAYNIARAKLKGIPYKLNYAVTYQCNAQCKICNIWKKYKENPEKQKEELTLEEIESIFTHFDLSWISLTGGEPFLRKDLADIIITVKEHNPHLHVLSIPTNGSLPGIIYKVITKILDETDIANVIISVSVDGDQKLHNTLRGVPGLWEKAQKTYELLTTIDNNRFNAFVEFTLSKYNAGALKKVLTSFGVDNSRIVLTAAHSSFFYRTGLSDLHEKSSIKEVQNFHNLLDGNTPINVITLLYTKLLEKYLKGASFPCVSGHSSFFLDPYGVLYPCIFVNEPVGNLKKSSLNQVLASEQKQLVISRLPQKCPGCWTPCEAYQTILEHAPHAVFAAYCK
ncbi:MAG: radical SAM protein [Candidatus Methanofastidiosia archaeon]|jgi:MoaA/NifB/PqqE/SkfB family radical SAM enzyme